MAFAYHDRATVRFMQDDLPGALEDEDSAIEFSPRDAVYYERRADFRLRSNDPDGAMDDAEAALGLQPLAPQALYEKGVALRRQGKAADSVATLDQLLQLNPRYPGALFERAMAKYVKGDFSGTEADLKANRVHTIERPYTELWLWIVATEQGEADADRELEAYLTDARNLAPDTWQEKLGDMVLGRTTPDVLAASLEIGPNNRENREHRCELWFLAGKMALVHGDKATAKVDFQKAVATHTADTVEFCEAQRDLTKL
jgi:lipoprotein NlpI